MTDEQLKLELAAQIIMAPPDQVSAEHRKEAEAFLLSLKDGTTPISIEICRQILESTTNEFLMFQVTQILVSRLLKEWNTLDERQVEAICIYLLRESPALRTGIPNFVRAEIVRAASMIIKRASLKMDILKSDEIIGTIENYVRSEDERMQIFGLQIIEAMAVEFSTAWRSSTISITWDFHLSAKKRFEEILLKRFMRFSLSMLSQLLQTDLSTHLHIQICEKLLRVSTIVLSWDFSSKFIIYQYHLKIVMGGFKSSTFRPPASWSEFFANGDILVLFMQLHTKIRNRDDELCQTSMTCLVQLASVIGDVFEPVSNGLLCADDFGSSSLNDTTNSYDIYVEKFIALILDVFSNGVLEAEMASLSLMLYKLLTCHPLTVFLRRPSELMTRFIGLIFENIIKITGPAMRLALNNNDQMFHEALHNFYQVWRTLYRMADAVNMYPKKYGVKEGEASPISLAIKNSNPKILEAFLLSVLSPPFGERIRNDGTAELIDENEEEDDDRAIFSDVLHDIGDISIKSLDFFIGYISRGLNERIKQLRNISPDVSPEFVQQWQEDLHWLLLLAGHFLQHQSFDIVGNLPEEVAFRCLSGYKTGEFDPIDFVNLVAVCLDNPFDIDCFPKRLDPLSLLSLEIISWFAMEHKMLVGLSGDASLLSPELTRTSFWVFTLLMTVLTPPTGDALAELELKEYTLDEYNLLPKIAPSLPLYQKIFEMAMDKVVAVLTKMSGEKKVCEDAINVVISVAENQADMIAENEHFYQLLFGLDFANLPSRRPLTKSLVVIGSAVNLPHVRQKMYEMILEPMLARFIELYENPLCENPTAATDSQLADFYECFSGVADAGNTEAALVLFRYLQPALERCAPLMLSRPHSQLLVNSVLEFLNTVTDVLFFYVESNDECSFFSTQMLAVVEAYRATQLDRYRSAEFLNATGNSEEQQTRDMIILIEVLCHSISKTYMPQFEGSGSVENSAKIALIGLEMILPLMNEALLKVPDLCTSLFRFLLFVSDLASDILFQVREQTILDLLRCVNLALDNEFGFERMKVALEVVTNLASQQQCHKLVDEHEDCSLSESSAITPTTTTKTNHNNFIATLLAQFVDRIFETALQYSCDVEIFNEASSALFAVISLNKENFMAHACSLLQLPSNMPNREHLQTAFQQFFAGFEQTSTFSAKFPIHSRLEKRAFQERFQTFLADVSGILCLH